MRQQISCLTLSLLALMVSACGASENDPGPGGVTVGEAEMLDDAAEMLDERKADFKKTPGDQAQPGDGN
jgi:hypothetical protein